MALFEADLLVCCDSDIEGEQESVYREHRAEIQSSSIHSFEFAPQKILRSCLSHNPSSSYDPYRKRTSLSQPHFELALDIAKMGQLHALLWIFLVSFPKLRRLSICTSNREAYCPSSSKRQSIKSLFRMFFDFYLVSQRHCKPSKVMPVSPLSRLLLR